MKKEKEKDKARREKLSGYFYDLSKLCFTGMFIGILIPLVSNTGDVRMWILALFGIILTILSAMLANKLMK